LEGSLCVPVPAVRDPRLQHVSGFHHVGENLLHFIGRPFSTDEHSLDTSLLALDALIQLRDQAVTVGFGLPGILIYWACLFSEPAQRGHPALGPERP